MPDSSAEDFPHGWNDDDASRPISIPPDLVPPADSEMPLQGMWLTASAWLPPETLSPGSAGPAGFGQGGAVDQMPPGPALATFTANAAAAEPASDEAALHGLSDEELTGVIRGWRKLSSWAQAGELAAVAEMAVRRHTEALSAGDRQSVADEAATDEIAAALTLTSRAAQALSDRATSMQELPATRAALAAGRIDMPRALVMLNSLAGQDPALARAVEAQVIDQAPAQTTGQLRASVNRALLAADPDAAEKRRKTEEQHARIEQLPEPGGCTASLTGRFLPVAGTVNAWNRLTALARALRSSGAPGSLDELRAQVFLALLTGQGVAVPDSGAADTEASPGPAGDANEEDGDEDGVGQQGAEDSSPASSDGAGSPPAGGVPAVPDVAPSGSLTGNVNLTVPLSTLLRLTDSPGDLGGFGPITAHTAREIAASALDAAAVRWCLTVTGETGQAIAHGCATRTPAAPARAAPSTPPAGHDPGKRNAPGAPPASGPPGSPAAPGTSGWTFSMKITALAGSDCGHQRESAHYRPPPSLWHLVQIRNPRCTAPGCRMPAARCDDDHTLAFDKGGKTCECNLGPLCRHHHRVKQSQGWRLEQPEPGIYAWVTPAGWQFITGPESYSA
jgi:hypothetical protein